MYPYIHLGSWHIPTFGLLLGLGAVGATAVLQRNFTRNGVDADALTVVALSTLAGIVGAKAWHELQDPRALSIAWQRIVAPGVHHPLDVLLGFLHWFQAGFAWYGGLLGAIGTLMVQGAQIKPNGLRAGRAMMRMLDLAAPAAAVGYGVGRLGCLTSGDGDYGKVTTLPWGVHMKPDALVPTPNLVQPTPAYEFLFALALAWYLWKRQQKPRTLGFLTGEYLLWSGVARFLVEFVRINPHVYGAFTNAQVAAALSAVVGIVIMLVANRHPETALAPLSPVEQESFQAALRARQATAA